MAQIIAISRSQWVPSGLSDVLRAAIVSGCALALIAAGPFVPF
jgi:hypothetical protein